MDEGWRLLQAGTSTELGLSRYQPPDPTALARLDEWESRWYAIVRATLGRHLPDVAESVFLDLAQAAGAEVPVSLAALVGRLRHLERDDTERTRQASALLAKRGLTEAVLAEPEALLSRFQTLPEPAPEEPEEEDHSAAEDATWAWSPEWSAIARQAIAERSLLSSLGFLRSNGGRDEAAPCASSAMTRGRAAAARGSPPTPCASTSSAASRAVSRSTRAAPPTWASGTSTASSRSTGTARSPLARTSRGAVGDRAGGVQGLEARGVREG